MFPFRRTVLQAQSWCRLYSQSSRKSTPSSASTLDVMIPGQYLKYFKSKDKKERRDHAISDHSTATLDKVYKKAARPVAHDEFDSAPSVAQQRLAQRIGRAMTLMYTIETMPSKWISQDNVSINAIKVSRNLRKCQIYYDPLPTSKQERGHVHRALQTHSARIESLLRSHASLRRPLSIKFVSDTRKRELESVFRQLDQEIQNDDTPNSDERRPL